jgi:restriction endonuclease S subunit
LRETIEETQDQLEEVQDKLEKREKEIQRLKQQIQTYQRSKDLENFKSKVKSSIKETLGVSVEFTATGELKNASNDGLFGCRVFY